MVCFAFGCLLPTANLPEQWWPIGGVDGVRWFGPSKMWANAIQSMTLMLTTGLWAEMPLELSITM